MFAVLHARRLAREASSVLVMPVLSRAKAIKGVFLALLCVVSANALSKDLFEYSLEELMTVVVVSGKEETIRHSPGTVSTYYPDQLQNMGLHTLRDMVRFAAGVQLTDSLIGEEVVQLRGLFDADNQKILFMVDGIPYWMSSHGNVPLYGIPLLAIEQIEVIRGPASVAYGTNSSAGVINVVTRKQAINGASLTVANHNQRTVNAVTQRGFAGGQLLLALEHRNDDGFDAEARDTFIAFDPSCGCFPTVDKVHYQNSLEHDSAMARLNYQGLTLTVQAFESRRNQLANNSALTPGQRKQFGQLVSARYQKNLGLYEFEVYSDWNRFYREDTVENFLSLFGIDGNGAIDLDNNGANNTRWLNGVRMETQLSAQLSWLAGFEYEERATENSRFRDDVQGAQLSLLAQPPFNRPFEFQDDGSLLLFEEDSLSEISAFTQFDYVSGDWRYVAGLRHVDNEFSGEHTAPRLAAVWSYNEQDSIKWLYGVGFNSPTFRQLSARNQVGVKQDIDIQAEIIHSYEVSWVRTLGHRHHSLTAFHIEADKLIQANGDGVVNADDAIERNGLEYEFRYRNAQWAAWWSTTYLHQGNQSIRDDRAALYASRWMGKIGVQRKGRRHTLGAALNASSPRYQVDEQYWLNLHYRHRWQALSGYVTVVNALDQTIMHPDVRSQQEVQLQAVAGRHLIAGIEARF